jgi:Sulfotransferase domain
MPPDITPFNKATNMPSPRFIKTHLPVSLVPDQIWTVAPKIVYVRRNPKDVAVSYFHHTALLHDYTGNMEDFVEAFIADLAYYSPYHSHILEYNAVAGKCENVLLLKFEDMKTNLEENVRKTAKFFNKSYSDEQVKGLCEHLSFKEMRKNESLNYECRIKKILEHSNRSQESNENLQ